MTQHSELKISKFRFVWGLALVCSLTCSGDLRAVADEPASTIGNCRPTATAPPINRVKVITSKEGEVTHFYVRNDEFCEVTMTFDMALNNLTGSTRFPCTITFPARETTEAFSLWPSNPEAKWSYDYTNYFKLGSASAQHDDKYVYQLPFETGRKFKVTQGYNGSFSHKGSNQYAIDWKMPEGTLVWAARGGVVVRAKDDSNRGGPSLDYDKFNNYVLIRHPDGTLGHYCHLQKGGCLVKVGQVVATGQAIAHSGSTGFSSGPHLHFCVFKTKSGKERVSIPVKFHTATEAAVTLAEGRTYRAAQVQTADIRPAGMANEPGQGGSRE